MEQYHFLSVSVQRLFITMNHKLPYAIFQNLIRGKSFKLNDFQLFSNSSNIIFLAIFNAPYSTSFEFSQIAPFKLIHFHLLF